MKPPKASRRGLVVPPVAIGVDGHVYMSVFELDGVETLEDALGVVGKADQMFVGVALTPGERRRLLRHLGDAAHEATAFIAGRRRWRP